MAGRREVIGKIEPTQFANVGKILKSPWKFRQYGECGTAGQRSVSAHWPLMNWPSCDRRSQMPLEHTFANYFRIREAAFRGDPVMGALDQLRLGIGMR